MLTCWAIGRTVVICPKYLDTARISDSHTALPSNPSFSELISKKWPRQGGRWNARSQKTGARPDVVFQYPSMPTLVVTELQLPTSVDSLLQFVIPGRGCSSSQNIPHFSLVSSTRRWTWTGHFHLTHCLKIYSIKHEHGFRSLLTSYCYST